MFDTSLNKKPAINDYPDIPKVDADIIAPAAKCYGAQKRARNSSMCSATSII